MVRQMDLINKTQKVNQLLPLSKPQVKLKSLPGTPSQEKIKNWGDGEKFGTLMEDSLSKRRREDLSWIWLAYRYHFFFN